MAPGNNDDDKGSSSPLASSQSEKSDPEDQHDAAPNELIEASALAAKTEEPLASSAGKKRIRLSFKRPSSGFENPLKGEIGDGVKAILQKKDPQSTCDTTTKQVERSQVQPSDSSEPTSPPKKRIKLIIPKTAKSNQAGTVPKTETPLALSTTTANPPSTSSPADPPLPAIVKEEPVEEASEVSILDNNYNGEDDVVAAVVAEPGKQPAKSSTGQKIKKGPANATQVVPLNKKKSVPYVARSARLPPISSPGLMIPSGNHRVPVDANGLVSPNAIFTEAMDVAGYNLEARINKPHRGSSVQRVIDDMFDSNVKLCPNFPPLVPEKYLRRQHEQPSYPTSSPEMPSQAESTSETAVDGTKISLPSDDDRISDDKRVAPSLAERLFRALGSSSPAEEAAQRQVSSMFPLSLTLPYPNDFIDRQQEYAKLVDLREKAIVAQQEEEVAIDIARERSEMSDQPYTGPLKPSVQIPPIPVPPEPCKLTEIPGMNLEDFDQQHHPIYISKEDFVDHLDKRCFHITEGRYFGLISNGIADPHFVGPNAPGIGGLHLSSTSGLTTANTSLGGLLFAGSPAFAGPKQSVGLGINSSKSVVKKPNSKPPDNSKTPSAKQVPPTKTKSSVTKKKIVLTKKSATSGTKEIKRNGPTVTATASDLRKIMDGGGEEAEKMKSVIIKAAVHATRANKFENRSFRAMNRKVYPDVAKACSAYAGLKPCAKCKANKQGTHNCRLRRRHTALDYDGGDSWKVLEPLFDMPIGDLIIKPLKKEKATAEKTESGKDE